MLGRSFVFLLAVTCVLQTASCRPVPLSANRRNGAVMLRQEENEYDVNVAPESVVVNEGFLKRLSSNLKALMQYFRPRSKSTNDPTGSQREKVPVKPVRKEVPVKEVNVLKRYHARMKKKKQQQLAAAAAKEPLQLYGALSPKFQMGFR